MQNSHHTIVDSSTKSGQEKTFISLDNTSHPGRPGLDELVPSRYALKVGEIDVMVISHGVLPLPGALLGHNVDSAVRTAWLKDKFLPSDVLEWALNVVVARSGGRTILIDVGLGMDRDLEMPQAGKLAQRLQAAGIDLPSVTDGLKPERPFPDAPISSSLTNSPCLCLYVCERGRLCSD
jgi:hypothetical protein